MMIEITVGPYRVASSTILEDTSSAVMRTNNDHEEQEKNEKLQDGEETTCKKEYRKDSGQAGNLGGSGEYLSEIDILSPLTSSPKRSSAGIRLNLLYKNLKLLREFQRRAQRSSSLFLSYSFFFLYSPSWHFLAHFAHLLSTLSARILVSFARLTTFTARLALHFSFLRCFFPYISNDRLGSREVPVLRAHR